MEEYDIIEIQGKHGLIKLHVPKKEATEEDINELHRVVAKTIINSNKQKAAEK